MAEFNSKIATVVCRNGQHHIILPSGEELPGVYLTRVMDEAGEMPEVMVKMSVNIAESTEQALKLYAKQSLKLYAKAQEEEKDEIQRVAFKTEKGWFLAVRFTTNNVTIRESRTGTHITDGDRRLNLIFHVGEPMPISTMETEHKKDIVDQIEWGNGLKTYKSYIGLDFEMVKLSAESSFKTLMMSNNIDMNEPGWVIFKQV